MITVENSAMDGGPCDVVPTVIAAALEDGVSRLILCDVHTLQRCRLGKYDAVDLFHALLNLEELEHAVVAVYASRENCSGNGRRVHAPNPVVLARGTVQCCDFESTSEIRKDLKDYFGRKIRDVFWLPA